VSPADRARPEGIVADRNSASKHVWRANIVLATADGLGTNAIMRLTSKSKQCVWRWQERYIETDVDGLLCDKTRPSRKKPLSAEVRLKVLTMTMQPPPNAMHLSTRSMAKVVGISHSSVQRIWREADLKPHLVRTFKVSNDPKFAEKVTDVVGLYMNPPDKALVLCVDEKNQIQALDCTQPGLPLKKGRAAMMTHDYKRNGTTTLFAALNVKTGEVIGKCLPRHRAKKFIKFLHTIDTVVDKFSALGVHLILDNYGTHKTGQAAGCHSEH
jgi:transposase